MLVLGLAGHADSGKDSVADYLVERYGFIKFSFSDALYREVAEAFDIAAEEIDELLRDRAVKDKPLASLRLQYCGDTAFVEVANAIIAEAYSEQGGLTIPDQQAPRSPRQILQWWGTEYRRVQDPDYWVRQADEWLYQVRTSCPYPELRPMLFVNTSVRFTNEQGWIHAMNEGGGVWHLRRDAATPVNPHESETPLPVLDGERQIWNNHTLEYLYMAVDQLLSSPIPSIRCEPMEEK